MRQRNQLGARCKQRLERTEIDAVVFGQRADVDLRARALGGHLPGHDIRMVFERGQDDPVAFADIGHSPARSDEIDRLGRAAHEDNLVLATRTHEIGGAPARGLVAQRHLCAATIDPAMDRRIIAAQRAVHRIDHGLRLLRRSRRVEIMPRRTVGRDQPGKIRLAGQSRRVGHSALSTLSSATRIILSRSSSSSSATSASPTKAWTSNRRARSGERPRAAM